jgi:hypothetical protein
MSGDNLPPGVNVVAGGGQWAGPDPKAPGNEFDVWAVTDDGRLAHWWWKTGIDKWEGPEYFGH